MLSDPQSAHASLQTIKIRSSLQSVDLVQLVEYFLSTGLKSVALSTASWAFNPENRVDEPKTAGYAMLDLVAVMDGVLQE